MEAEGRPRTLGAIARSWALGGCLLGMLVAWVVLMWPGETRWAIAVIGACGFLGLLLGDFEDALDGGLRASSTALLIGAAAAHELGHVGLATVVTGLAIAITLVPEEKVRDRRARRRMPPPEWPVTSSDR
ncbi:hypothetical protein [Aeromicrobium choanae]|uniref:Uncharacterized protein n=1 Tax=Aeromicrobium choanae TaxID=1736691 RepID=A0A1T4Z1Z7_9ACTN|nr:hypothetical protein [Aeromicrobium choanae]SKB07838.1 hypothetical protein SAMN06295964_1862 [Aeromicrobium choanae]